MYYKDLKQVLDSLNEEYKIVSQRDECEEFNVNSFINEYAESEYCRYKERNTEFNRRISKIEERIKALENARWKSRSEYVPEEGESEDFIESYLNLFYDKWEVTFADGQTNCYDSKELERHKKNLREEIEHLKSYITNYTIEGLRAEPDYFEIYTDFKIYTPTRIIFYGSEQECGNYYFEVSIDDLTTNNPLYNK